MSSIGKRLVNAIEDALQNGFVTIRTSIDVALLRKRLRLSQNQFAKIYHINPETLRKWEQHKREPDSISRAYLKCIDKNPDVIKQLVNS